MYDQILANRLLDEARLGNPRVATINVYSCVHGARKEGAIPGNVTPVLFSDQRKGSGGNRGGALTTDYKNRPASLLLDRVK